MVHIGGRLWFAGPCPISLAAMQKAIGWLQRVTWKKRYRVRLKRIVCLQNYNSWNFCFCSRETGGFFTWGLKKVVPLKQCPLYVLTALEMCKREVYRKQTISHVSVFLNKVSAVEHDRFMQASLCTVSLTFANTLA